MDSRTQPTRILLRAGWYSNANPMRITFISTDTGTRVNTNVAVLVVVHVNRLSVTHAEVVADSLHLSHTCSHRSQFTDTDTSLHKSLYLIAVTVVAFRRRLPLLRGAPLYIGPENIPTASRAFISKKNKLPQNKRNRGNHIETSFPELF